MRKYECVIVSGVTGRQFRESQLTKDEAINMIINKIASVSMGDQRVTDFWRNKLQNDWTKNGLHGTVSRNKKLVYKYIIG